MVRIIAEAGVNHFGRIDLAKQLVREAKYAGADYIKFQFVQPDEVYLPGKYKYGPYDSEDVIKQRLDCLLTFDEYRDVFDYAISIGIEPFATPFGLSSLDLLKSLGCNIVKISSGDINFYDLILGASSSFDMVILSTGMATLEEIDYAYNLACQGSATILLMHCVSIYPHSDSQSNLGFLKTLSNRYPVSLGYSDHTLGFLSAGTALGLGATFFEKHFTTDRQLGGLDKKHSLEPEEFKEYVGALRSIEISVQKTYKDIGKDELYTAERARRGLYFSRDLDKGHILREGDVLFLRPKNGLDLLDLKKLVGKKLLSNVSQYESLEGITFE